MATVFFPLGQTRTSLGAGGTVYFPFANGNLSSALDNLFTVRTAGSASQLYLRVVSNDRGASSYKIRINGVDGSLSVSIAASTTGEFEDNSNTSSIAAADKVNFGLSIGAGGTSFIPTTSSCLFAASTNTVQRIHPTPQNAISTDSTTFFYAFGGRIAFASTTESNEQIDVETAGTLKNFGVRVSLNGRTTATIVGIRKNGLNGNQAISVAAATTGVFEDTTNTDTVTVDDAVCFFATTGTGGGSFRFINGAWVEFETTNSQWQIFTGQSGGDGDATFAVGTYFIPVGGILTNDYTATESETSLEPQTAFTASKLQCRVITNTITAASTLRFRTNGLNGNQVVTIAASTSGLFQDATGTDTIGANDDINYQLATGGTGTSVILSCISMLCAGGQTFSVSLSGGLTPAAALIRQPRLGFAGAITPAGALVRQPRLGMAGTVTPAGALAVLKVVVVALTGTVTSAGSLIRQTAKLLAGTLGPAGALAKRLTMFISASIAPAGALTKRIGRLLSGTLALAGALTTAVTTSTRLALRFLDRGVARLRFTDRGQGRYRHTDRSQPRGDNDA